MPQPDTQDQIISYLSSIARHLPLAEGEEADLVDALVVARAAGADLAAGAGQGSPVISRALDRLVKEGVRAERRLVEAHLRIVPDIAEQAASYRSLPMRTLARGNEALWLSVRTYRDRSEPFVDHAVRCVKEALLEVASAGR